MNMTHVRINLENGNQGGNMIKLIISSFLISFSALSYAISEPTMVLKALNPDCIGVTGSNFSAGDGSTGNPYLICTKEQLNRLSVEPILLTNHFKLGNNFSYLGENFYVIGDDNTPFEGSLNGDDYALSNLNIVDRNNRQRYLGMFGYTQNASISNLIVNGLTLSAHETYQTGALIGEAHDTTIDKVRISNINVRTTDYSGGFIGTAYDTLITNSGVQGEVVLSFGSDAVGGLIGQAVNVDISMSYSKVNLRQKDDTDFGVSNIGGLCGLIQNGKISDSYVLGNIDFSKVKEPGKPWSSKAIAGIAPGASGTTITNVFYAGRFINLTHVEYLGGAVSFGGSIVSNLFWDTTLSNYTQSAAGIGQTTTIMKSRPFWLGAGFSPTKWNIRKNTYPRLIWE